MNEHIKELLEALGIEIGRSDLCDFVKHLPQSVLLVLKELIENEIEVRIQRERKG